MPSRHAASHDPETTYVDALSRDRFAGRGVRAPMRANLLPAANATSLHSPKRRAARGIERADRSRNGQDVSSAAKSRVLDTIRRRECCRVERTAAAHLPALGALRRTRLDACRDRQGDRAAAQLCVRSRARAARHAGDPHDCSPQVSRERRLIHAGDDRCWRWSMSRDAASIVSVLHRGVAQECKAPALLMGRSGRVDRFAVRDARL